MLHTAHHIRSSIFLKEKLVDREGALLFTIALLNGYAYEISVSVCPQSAHYTVFLLP